VAEIRLLLADDQDLFITSLKKVLELSAPDIEVVGIVHNGREAIEAVEQLHPDVILMDVRMPVLDGVEATREIHSRYPDIHIMMLTTFDKDTYVQDALRYGATAYLLKDIALDELIASIRAIQNVSVLLSPRVAEHFLSAHEARPLDEYVDAEDAQKVMKRIGELSRREKDVFDLVLQGYDNQGIGEKLYIAEQTVRNYISRIYAKLGVEGRLDLIRKLKHN
jgi:DNA-binding NarL/FixJ family response regulator